MFKNILKAIQKNQQRRADYWKQDGNTWTRYHKLPRRQFFDPSTTPDGPDVTLLDERRTTMTRYLDGTTEVHNDTWKQLKTRRRSG